MCRVDYRVSPCPIFDLILDNFPTILGTAVGLVLIGFSVSIAAVRSYANKYDYRIDIDQELLALGASNLASSVFQGIFVNGSLSKTPVADDAGAKSQMYNLIQAGLIILTLLFLAPMFSLLPQAVLGAVIIQAVVTGMMDVGEMKRIYKIKRSEFWIALTCLTGCGYFWDPVGGCHWRSSFIDLVGGSFCQAYDPGIGAQTGHQRLLRPATSSRQ